jgi:dTDP-4-dehydrorhamnose reductase
VPVRVLLTGASGQVGGDLLPMLEPFASVIAPSRSELDLRNPGEIQRFVRESKPDWIINPAAYTAVDKAESEPELAYAINANAPRALGEAAAQLRVPVIHFSTDYVYSGAGNTPWVEEDESGPLGVYGASKLAGDRALAASGAAHLILRTSWVYGTRGKNFLRTILRFAREKDELRIVDDQHGSPTWSRDLARAVVHIIRGMSEKSAAHAMPVQEIVQEVQGVYHVAGAGDTTWFGFAREFLRIAAEVRPGSKLARLTPIETGEYPTPARRPLNSRLDCSRIRDVFGVALPMWEESAAAVTREVLSD